MAWGENYVHVCDISRPAAITGSVRIIENRRGAHFEHNNNYIGINVKIQTKYSVTYYYVLAECSSDIYCVQIIKTCARVCVCSGKKKKKTFIVTIIIAIYYNV